MRKLKMVSKTDVKNIINSFLKDLTLKMKHSKSQKETINMVSSYKTAIITEINSLGE